MIANLDADLHPSGKWDKEPIDRAMLALTRRSLLNVDASRYTMHAIVRDYAYPKLSDPAAHHRAATTHFCSLYTLDAHIDPTYSVADVQPLLDAFDQLCAAGEWLAAADLMLGDYLLYERNWDKPRWLLSISPPYAFDDYLLYESNWGKTLHERLVIWGESSRIVRLLGRLVVPPAADQLLPEYLGIVLGNLGLAYAYLGNARAAIDYFERALKIAEQVGDLKLQGVVLGNLGIPYAYLGDVRKAIDYFERALKIYEQIGHLRRQGAHLSNLGLAYAELGDARVAIGYFERALKIAEQIGDPYGQGVVLGNLGDAYARLGDARAAIDYFERALKIAKQIGDLLMQGAHLSNLKLAYTSLGETDKAAAYNSRAIPIQRQIGEMSGEAIGWNNLGILHVGQGRYLDTLACYLRSLLTLRRIEDPNIKQTWRNILTVRVAVSEADWPALVQQAAATLAAEGMELPAALLEEVRNITPAEDAPPASQAV